MPPHWDFSSISSEIDAIDHEQQQDEEEKTKHLILVGGGHGHVQVIKALNGDVRPKRLRVTLIDVQAAASYSGMVPGCVAGLYTHDETRLSLAPLAQWASVDYIQDEVVDINLEQKLVFVTGRCGMNDTAQQPGTSLSLQPIPFDAISMDIGSTSRDLYKVPGAAEFTIPTRPISDLVLKLQKITTEEVENSTDGDDSIVRVVIVGAGVAGIELAMSIHGRWIGKLGQDRLHVTILDAACRNDALLPGESEVSRRKLYKILQDKGIHLQFECGIERITETTVILRRPGSEPLPFDTCIWATGAGAHDLAWKLADKEHGLAVDKYGWFQVNEYMQSISHPFLFAAGDCCSHPSNPPKAGVYAVRAGPILIQNLTRYIFHGTTPAQFKPQDDFLKLLACGDGTSLGFRFGIPIHGKWVWSIKDTIDTAFMNLFRVEHLPTTNKEKLYDTSQYDAAYACKDHENALNAREAAALLRREDDDVDYQLAWKVLRDMVCMKDYRAQVLKHWHGMEDLLQMTGGQGGPIALPIDSRK